MLDRVNPSVIGYALNIVGLFFLASAITFKRPRRQVEELLGIERSRSLYAIREQIVNQTQTYIGFGILVVGFVLVMMEALERRASSPAPAAGPEPVAAGWIFAILLGAVALTTLVLKVVQRGFVKSKFRRIVREVVRDSKFNLEKNPTLAVQIGELLHIPKQPDQSVTDYVAKVRSALGVEPGEAGRAKTRPA
jgi:hypothetical protein